MPKRASWRHPCLALLVPTSVRVVLLGADPWLVVGTFGGGVEALLAGLILVSGVIAAPDPNRKTLLHLHAYKSPRGDRIQLLSLHAQDIGGRACVLYAKARGGARSPHAGENMSRFKGSKTNRLQEYASYLCMTCELQELAMIARSSVRNS